MAKITDELLICEINSNKIFISTEIIGTHHCFTLNINRKECFTMFCLEVCKLQLGKVCAYQYLPITLGACFSSSFLSSISSACLSVLLSAFAFQIS